MDEQTVIIHADGACSPNPGIGGWGVIMIHDGVEREFSGYVDYTTNNRMELTAVIEALKLLKQPSNVQLFTDSTYVVKGIGDWKHGRPIRQGWMVKWKRNNWVSRYKKVLNTDLWQELHSIVPPHLSFISKWVKGHNNDHYNERVDRLAVAAYTNKQ